MCIGEILIALKLKTLIGASKTRMWANVERDGRPAECRWRSLFNANAAKLADANYSLVVGVSSWRLVVGVTAKTGFPSWQ